MCFYTLGAVWDQFQMFWVRMISPFTQHLMNVVGRQIMAGYWGTGWAGLSLPAENSQLQRKANRYKTFCGLVWPRMSALSLWRPEVALRWSIPCCPVKYSATCILAIEGNAGGTGEKMCVFVVNLPPALRSRYLPDGHFIDEKNQGMYSVLFCVSGLYCTSPTHLWDRSLYDLLLINESTNTIVERKVPFSQ